MLNNFYAVIMAGGQGTRLWPLSRKAKPKQLQAISSEKPMIKDTYERLLPKFKPEKIVISTTPEFADEIKNILPEIPEENYIVEPLLMGNAAACGLVSTILFNRDKDSSAIFLPSDHTIEDKKEFVEVIDFAENLLEKYSDNIITIGINPTKPDVNLGYIQMDSQIEVFDGLKAFSVKRFIEKPDQKRAEKYASSWNYLWNAGIFIWRNDHILSLFEKNMPQTFKHLQKIGQNWGKDSILIKNEYNKVEVTSIDYGIIEKTKNILVIPADFGWSDVGSWGSLLEVLKNTHGTNVISRGHHVGVDNSDCLVLAGEKLIATVGLKNIVVIDTPDALLICNSKESHKVKDLLNKFKDEGKHLYL